MKVLELSDIGEVNVVRTARGRYMRLQVNPEKGVQLTIPRHISLAEAEKWLRTKQAWLRKKMDEINRQKERQTVYLPGTTYFTRFHLFRLVPWEKEIFRLRMQGKQALLYVPAGLSPESDEVQQAARDAMIRIMRKEAQEFLPGRVTQLAGRYRYHFNRVSVRNNLTRWGSCSARDHISLNIHLMRLPDHLVDYVILHELVHTRFRNHGPRFWQELDRVTGNARRLDRELKQYPIRIF